MGTPVQAAVKRADEQAFAAVFNGRNPMSFEDAARCIRHAPHGAFADPVHPVRHLESPHPHGAVAWADDDGAG